MMVACTGRVVSGMEEHNPLIDVGKAEGGTGLLGRDFQVSMVVEP